MASVEGAKRLKRLGAQIGIWGAMVAFLIWCADIYLNKVGAGAVVLMVAFPILVGMIVWVAGWVIEGFLSPDRNACSRQ
jgi:hypothetical protein